MRFKIRGIYATAIAKLLLDHGFILTQPSEVLRRRLGVEARNEPHDVMIIEGREADGLRVRGRPRAVEEVLKVIREHFDDAIIWRYRPDVNAIYLGVVKEQISDTKYVVDLGEYEGELVTDRVLHEGQRLLVCVRRGTLEGRCELTERLTLVGKYARLVKGGQNVVSPHIYDPEKRAELLALALSMAPKGWGIRWRSSAEHAPEEELRRDVEQLLKEAEELERMPLEGEPRLIREGEALAEIEMPFLSKLAADDIRNQVLPTLRGHHHLKSLGREVAAFVDFAEYLIAEGLDRELVSRGTIKYLVDSWLEEGRTLGIEHVTLDGERVALTPGEIIKLQDKVIVLKRVFKSPGVFDGLNLPKQPGDYALTHIVGGSMIVVSKYFRANGEYLGVYVNVNTPVELRRDKVKYVDLAVDVVMRKDDEPRIIDLEELERARARGVIGEKLYKRAREIAERVRERLAAGEEPESLLEEFVVR